MAPSTAKLNVMAMGRNILPSMPVRVMMGMKTVRMMKSPKTADRNSFEDSSMMMPFI